MVTFIKDSNHITYHGIERNWALFSKRLLNKDKTDFQSIYKKGIEELNEIILFCKKNKIQVCFIRSPQYMKFIIIKKNEGYM